MGVCSWVWIKADCNGLDQGLKQPVMDTVLNFSISVLGYRLCKSVCCQMTSSLSRYHARGQVLKQTWYSCNRDDTNWNSPSSVCWWWARSSRIVQEMGVLLTLPLSSREGAELESTVTSLFGTEASAEGWEIWSRDILIDSPTCTAEVPLMTLLFSSNEQALMKGL